MTENHDNTERAEQLCREFLESITPEGSLLGDNRVDVYTRLRIASAYLVPRSVMRQERILGEQHETLAQMLGCAHEHGKVLKQQQALLEALETESKKTGKTTRRLAWASFVFSLVAIGVSLAAVLTSRSWQTEQTPLLQQIRDRLPADQPSK